MKNFKNKIFNITTSFKSHEEDDSLIIRGMASTTDIDRVGDVILSDAWTKNGGLDNFKNNPIILFNHNYDEPIGTAVELEAGSTGLGMAARISKAAGKIYDLIKDDVLGAFSVSFMIKDADFIEETGGLKIKDAELFEVSVVSVPCNQTATFSLAKSFDSIAEYNEFKKTFTNSVDLAGQSPDNNEDNSSNRTSDTPDGVENSTHKEINMDEEQLEQLRKIAEEAAEKASRKIAMENAENKTAEDAAKAARVAAQKAQATVISDAVTTGTEKLLVDFQEKLDARNTDMSDVIKTHEADMKAAQKEITDMRNSRHLFVDRGTNEAPIEKFGDELLTAHMLGVITRKGFNTDFAKELAEKAGIDYLTQAADIDQEVSSRIEKEIQMTLKVAKLFREFKVNGAATVLPIQPDTGLADWAINATAGNLENRGASNNQYEPQQVILNAFRLVSSTFMDNDIDEQVLINLMPMLVQGVSRAHARTVEQMCLLGDLKSSSNITGLDGYAAVAAGQIDLDAVSIAAGDSALMTADLLLAARKEMGKYGISPTELAYIVSHESYYDLLSDAKFQTIDEVGSDVAVRITGSVGAVYGTPVIVSDEFAAEAADAAAAFVVHTNNYIIPRLRGVTVEQDYEVMNQRRVIVAAQSLGFEEILAGDAAGTEPSMKITFTA